MTDNLSIGIVYLQGTQQGDEGCTLLRSARVFRIAFLIKSAFITDTDGVGIVVAGMNIAFKRDGVRMTERRWFLTLR